MQTVAPVDVARARRVLQHKQRAFGHGLPPGTRRDPQEVAFERAAHRRAQARRDGDSIRYGTVRYPATVEEARWARTEEIIERTQAGPFEDGGYLEFLARQAATIELTLLDLEPDLASSLDGIVIGTTGEPRLHPTTIRVGGASAIAMAVGEVDLLYQVAKAVVLSWKPVPPPPGRLAALSPHLHDTIEVLDRDDTPVRIVIETLRSWLFDGRPRPFASASPPPVYHWPLSILSGGVERFVLAHEYAHAILDHMAMPALGFDELAASTQREREARADLFATFVVCESTGTLDDVGPNMGLQGAVLAMRVHELTSELLRTFGARAGLSGGLTHPPFGARIDAVIDMYAANFDDGVDIRLSVDALDVPLQTVDVLWDRAVGAIVNDVVYGRPLHPIWEAT